jgi:hypothetical protein
MSDTDDIAEPLRAPPQGDPRLLETASAQRLLTAAIPARFAYIGLDGSPRVIPMSFVWNGAELVMGAFAGTYKLPALRARPDVAVTIDSFDGSPQVLLLRGSVTLDDVDGVLPEYAAAQLKMNDDEATRAYLQSIDRPGLRMVRIGLRPIWVGVLDFASRFPERTPTLVLESFGAPS